MNWQQITILGALLGTACVTDVAARRIPNAVVAAIAASGLWAQWWSAGIRGAGLGLLAGSIVLVGLFPGWSLGKLGGGDVKLAAAVAVWVGPSKLLAFALFTGAAGLPVAAASWAAHRVRLWRVVRAAGDGDQAVAVPSQRLTVPLAVAIALGAAAALSRGTP